MDYIEEAKRYRRRNKAMVKQFKTGKFSQSELARKYGMHRQQVHFILRRDMERK